MELTIQHTFHADVRIFHKRLAAMFVRLGAIVGTQVDEYEIGFVFADGVSCQELNAINEFTWVAFVFAVGKFAVTH